MRLLAFGIEFDVLSKSAVIGTIADWLRSPIGHGCRYVVTPNVDHVLQLRSDRSFRLAYNSASLRVVDGWPVALALRWISGAPVETVPGSDLVPGLFDALAAKGAPTPVFLLGAADGVAAIAAENIKRRWPHISVVGHYSPPFGFEKDQAECARICELVRSGSPTLLVIGLGAPKQELWAYRHREDLGDCVALCVGATIDFVAGAKKRASLWVRKCRVEWLHRALSEPRRLGGRYARGAFLFPWYVLKEVVKSQRKGDGGR